MPLIVVDPAILAAAQQAIEVLLQFKGQMIALQPLDSTPIAKPGGGHDFDMVPPRAPQLLALSATSGLTVGSSTNDDGIVRTRDYVLTGRIDAEIGINDTWSDDEADYRVESGDQDNGYRTTATVIGFLKVRQTPFTPAIPSASAHMAGNGQLTATATPVGTPVAVALAGSGQFTATATIGMAQSVD